MARAGEGVSRCTTRPRSGRIPLQRRQAPCTIQWTWMTCLPPGGSRPDRLTEVRPQERVQRRTVEQIILAPMRDVPVQLMEEQLLVDAFACYDIKVPGQVIKVPNILIDDISVRTPVLEPQLAEQLRSSPFPRCSGLWSRTWTFQFRVVVCAVFKVFPQDRLQRRLLSLWSTFLSGMWSRSLVFPVEAFKIFFQDKVHPLLIMIQLVLMLLRMVFRTFPRVKKKCGVRSQPESDWARQCQLMDAGGL